jgi:pSer/pThr/pTyr-binding forkhead associated (FHA) protein
MNGLQYLERWIEQLVEEPFVRIFAGRLLPQDVARHLAQALEDGERLGDDGTAEVPGRYRVELNPQDLAELRRHHPDLEARLETALGELVNRMELRVHDAPEVLLRPDPDRAPRSVKILPADGVARLPDQTQDFDHARLEEALTRSSNGNHARAYLIIRGERTVDLTADQVRIGRALDNDIIIEDRQISRYHAELRQRYGRYILQDLGSSGGTTVNGYPAQEIILRPGDLISLSGIDLIYAESEPLERAEQGHTRPFAALEG